MPFQSEAQRRWMWANKPAMARRWAHETGRKKTHRKHKRKTARRRGRR